MKKIKLPKIQMPQKPATVMIILGSIFGFLAILGLACMFMLLKMPAEIFSFMHYGWIVGIGIALFLLSVIFGIIWLVKCPIKFIGITQVTLGLCTGFLLIMGMCYSAAPTYYISSAHHFSLFANLPPQEKGYNIEITVDIDFYGVNADGGFGNENNVFIINGNGHTVRNISYTKTLKDKTTYFWRASNKTKFYDLHFSDCDFYITPDCFSNETHEGFACNLYLFGCEESTPSTAGITVTNTTVHVYAPPEDIRHTPSYFDKVYPENENFDIEIIKEEN